jgi:hypothetical protein
MLLNLITYDSNIVTNIIPRITKKLLLIDRLLNNTFHLIIT